MSDVLDFCPPGLNRMRAASKVERFHQPIRTRIEVIEDLRFERERLSRRIAEIDSKLHVLTGIDETMDDGGPGNAA